MTTGETVYTVECSKHGGVDIPERSRLTAWKQMMNHGFACTGDLKMRRHSDYGDLLIAQLLQPGGGES